MHFAMLNLWMFQRTRDSALGLRSCAADIVDSNRDFACWYGLSCVDGGWACCERGADYFVEPVLVLAWGAFFCLEWRRCGWGYLTVKELYGSLQIIWRTWPTRQPEWTKLPLGYPEISWLNDGQWAYYSSQTVPELSNMEFDCLQKLPQDVERRRQTTFSICQY